MRLEISHTASLRLREEKYAEDMLALVHRNRDHLAPWLPWAASYHSLEDARTSILSHQQQAKEEQSLCLGLWIEEELAGMVSFTHIDQVRHKASLGYWICQDHMGQGKMHQACSRLLDYGFYELELGSIQAESAARNEASIRVLEGLGFRKTGKVNGPDWAQKMGLEYLRFRMGKEEWNRSKVNSSD